MDVPGSLGVKVRGQQKALELATQQLSQPKKAPNTIFILFCCLACVINLDTGILPASLYKIQEEIEMNFQQKANIGSLVFLGICIGSLAVTPVLQKYSASKTLTFMLICDIGFLLIFSTSYNLYVMYTSRFLIGFAKVFLVIYFPVWVNQFSPLQKSTQWMASLQAFTTLGVMIGYMMAGFIINFLDGTLTWRFSMQVQAASFIPLIIWLCCSDASKIDMMSLSKRERAVSIMSAGEKPPQEGIVIRIDTVSLSHFKAFLTHLKKVASTPLFIWVTLSLCSMYFVVNGIQYWITLYLIKILKENPLQVVVAFSVICITSPMVGVIFGGWLSDHFGGYKGNNLVTALQLCVVFAFLACIFAIPIGFVGSLTYVCPLLWMMMFFGACLVPTATGININSLTRDYQSTASAISQLFINIGSYLSPVLSALIMDSEGLTWGFRFILLNSIVGVFLLIVAWIIAYVQYRKTGAYVDFDESRDEVGDLFSYNNEVARRRMHSFSF